MLAIDDLMEYANKSPLTSKHAAAIVRGHHMMFISSNFFTTYGCDDGFSFHAEEVVLNKISNYPRFNIRKLSKYTMVVIRTHKNRLVESKPCSECLRKIRNAGIKKIVYSTKEGTLCTIKTKHIISAPSSGYIYQSKLNKCCTSTKKNF